MKAIAVLVILAVAVVSWIAEIIASCPIQNLNIYKFYKCFEIWIFKGLNSAITYCPQLVQCYQNVQQQQQLCDNLNNNQMNMNANADQCKASLHDYGTQLKVKQQAHESMVLQCLQNMAPKAIDLDPKKVCVYASKIPIFALNLFPNV